MFSSFVTVFSAFSFAGAMSATGSLHTVIHRMTEGVKSTFRLILTTILSALLYALVLQMAHYHCYYAGMHLKMNIKGEGWLLKRNHRGCGS